MSLFDEQFLAATCAPTAGTVGAPRVDPEPEPGTSYMRIRDEVLMKVHDCLTYFFNRGPQRKELQGSIVYEDFLSTLSRELYQDLAAARLDDPRRRIRKNAR